MGADFWHVWDHLQLRRPLRPGLLFSASLFPRDLFLASSAMDASGR